VGNLTKLTYPDSRHTAHSYLRNDWLKESITSDQDKTEFNRNKVGMPTQLTRSNSTVAKIKYDRVYRPLEVDDNQIGYGDHLVNKFNYTYNDIGHITQEKAEYGWRQPSQVETNYQYDGLHRLVDATSDDEESTQYQYDPVGNRLQLVEQLQQGPETRTNSFNPANQLTQTLVSSPMNPDLVTTNYSYDRNGNRTDKLILDNTGEDRGVAYSFDTENRLVTTQDYQRQLVNPGHAPDEPNHTNNGNPKNDPEPELPEESIVGLDVTAGTTSLDGTLEPNPTQETELIQLAHTNLEYDGNGRRLSSTYFSGASDAGKKTEYTFDRLDPIAEYSMWNGQRSNLYRTTHLPTLPGIAQATDLHSYQEFASEQAPNGTNYFFHQDGEGNISATTKHQGQSDHSYRYDEYGLILPDNSSGDQHGGGASGWSSPSSGGQAHNVYSLVVAL